ncbi:unnamed protein product [Camellia sinensis]
MNYSGVAEYLELERSNCILCGMKLMMKTNGDYGRWDDKDIEFSRRASNHGPNYDFGHYLNNVGYGKASMLGHGYLSVAPLLAVVFAMAQLGYLRWGWPFFPSADG